MTKKTSSGLAVVVTIGPRLAGVYITSSGFTVVVTAVEYDYVHAWWAQGDAKKMLHSLYFHTTLKITTNWLTSISNSLFQIFFHETTSPSFIFTMFQKLSAQNEIQ